MENSLKKVGFRLAIFYLCCIIWFYMTDFLYRKSVFGNIMELYYIVRILFPISYGVLGLYCGLVHCSCRKYMILTLFQILSSAVFIIFIGNIFDIEFLLLQLGAYTVISLIFYGLTNVLRLCFRMTKKKNPAFAQRIESTGKYLKTALCTQKNIKPILRIGVLYYIIAVFAEYFWVKYFVNVAKIFNVHEGVFFIALILLPMVSIGIGVYMAIEKWKKNERIMFGIHHIFLCILLFVLYDPMLNRSGTVLVGISVLLTFFIREISYRLVSGYRRKFILDSDGETSEEIEKYMSERK